MRNVKTVWVRSQPTQRSRDGGDGRLFKNVVCLATLASMTACGSGTGRSGSKEGDSLCSGEKSFPVQASGFDPKVPYDYIAVREVSMVDMGSGDEQWTLT